MTSSDDDDIPCLSAETCKALQEYVEEQSLKANELENHLLVKEKEIPGTSMIDEIWNLSQFWYDDETARVLSNEVHRLAGSTGKIALISCPTLYKYVKQLCSSNEVILLEFDKRFSIYGSDYIFYDCNRPSDLPAHLKNAFDVVVFDPPFLSCDCLKNMAVTVQFISKDKIILCTGAVMEDQAYELFGVKMCKFKPKHEKFLSNPFACFANYNFDEFVDTNYVNNNK